jgi:hypothetical protein
MRALLDFIEERTQHPDLPHYIIDALWDKLSFLHVLNLLFSVFHGHLLRLFFFVLILLFLVRRSGKHSQIYCWSIRRVKNCQKVNNCCWSEYLIVVWKKHVEIVLFPTKKKQKKYGFLHVLIDSSSFIFKN